MSISINERKEVVENVEKKNILNEPILINNKILYTKRQYEDDFKYKKNDINTSKKVILIEDLKKITNILESFGSYIVENPVEEFDKRLKTDIDNSGILINTLITELNFKNKKIKNFEKLNSNKGIELIVEDSDVIMEPKIFDTTLPEKLLKLIDGFQYNSTFDIKYFIDVCVKSTPKKITENKIEIVNEKDINEYYKKNINSTEFFNSVLKTNIPPLKREKLSYIDLDDSRLRFIFVCKNTYLNSEQNKAIQLIEENYLIHLVERNYPFLFATFKNHNSLKKSLDEIVKENSINHFDYFTFDLSKAYYSINIYKIFSLFKEMMSKEEFEVFTPLIIFFANICEKYKLEYLPICKHSQLIFSLFLSYLFEKNGITETNFYNFVDDFVVFGSLPDVEKTVNQIKIALESVDMKIGSGTYFHHSFTDKIVFLKSEFKKV